MTECLCKVWGALLFGSRDDARALSNACLREAFVEAYWYGGTHADLCEEIRGEISRREEAEYQEQKRYPNQESYIPPAIPWTYSVEVEPDPWAEEMVTFADGTRGPRSSVRRAKKPKPRWQILDEISRREGETDASLL